MKKLITALCLLLCGYFSNTCFADELKVEASADHCLNRIFDHKWFTWENMITSFENYLVTQGYLAEGDTNTYQAYYKLLKDYPYKKTLPPAESNEKNMELIYVLDKIGYLKNYKMDYSFFYDCFETAALNSQDRAESDVAIAGMAFKKVKDAEKVNKALLASMLMSKISEEDLKRDFMKKTIILAFYGDLLCRNYYMDEDKSKIKDLSLDSLLANRPLIKADISAEFPGGMEELGGWVIKNLRYPPRARENCEQGRVLVNFIIERDGSVSGVEVIKGEYNSLNAEAVRLFSSMPKWKPASKDGANIKVRYTFPLSFKLNDIDCK
jgi:TonB family protein